MKWHFIPSETNGLKLRCTHDSMALGDGHSLVNWLMSPLFAIFRATCQGSLARSAMVGIVSIFLTNFCWEAKIGCLLQSPTNYLKANSSGGREEGGSEPPSGAMAERRGCRGAVAERTTTHAQKCFRVRLNFILNHSYLVHFNSRSTKP